MGVFHVFEIVQIVPCRAKHQMIFKDFMITIQKIF